MFLTDRTKQENQTLLCQLQSANRPLRNPFFSLAKTDQLSQHHQRIITELSKAQMKLGNILASDNDEIQVIEDGKWF